MVKVNAQYYLRREFRINLQLASSDFCFPLVSHQTVSRSRFSRGSSGVRGRQGRCRTGRRTETSRNESRTWNESGCRGPRGTKSLKGMRSQAKETSRDRRWGDRSASWNNVEKALKSSARNPGRHPPPHFISVLPAFGGRKFLATYFLLALASVPH